MSDGRWKCVPVDDTDLFTVSCEMYIQFCIIYYFTLNYVQVNSAYKHHSVKGTWKYALYEQILFKYGLKSYVLFVNGKDETVFIESDLLYRGVLYRQVWLSTFITLAQNLENLLILLFDCNVQYCKTYIVYHLEIIIDICS
jgi:hypothetical protein